MVTLTRFEQGEIAPVDAKALEQQLAPFIQKREPGLGFALLRFDDGEADLYGLDKLSDGFSVDHVSGHAAWQTLFGIAQQFDLTIMAPGCPVMVTSKDSLKHLPKEMDVDKKVVNSAKEFIKFIAEG